MSICLSCSCTFMVVKLFLVTQLCSTGETECCHSGRYCIFSSPEPKARVSYCHSALSVVRPSVRRRRRRPSGVNFSHFRLLLQNCLMDFDETWYAWSTHGPLQVLLFFGQISPGADPGRGKNRSRGGPLLQETSSSEQKATATNRMHSNDLEACGKKCCYFWFHSGVKFLTRFWRLFGLSHFALF